MCVSTWRLHALADSVALWLQSSTSYEGYEGVFPMGEHRSLARNLPQRHLPVGSWHAQRQG